MTTRKAAPVAEPDDDDETLDGDAAALLDQDVPAIVTSGSRALVDGRDRLKFRVDEDLYWFRRPKTKMLANLALYMEHAEDPARTDAQRAQALLVLGAEFLRFVEQPGQRHLEQRMDDPDDDFDLETIVPLVKTLGERLFAGRPTTPPRGSSRTVARPARGSRARTR